jgi:LysM repeat protein
MKKLIRAASLIMLALGLGARPVQAAPRLAPNAYEVIAAVNALRASYGLDAYAVDGRLMISAQAQADYLAGMYPDIVDGHTGPGGTDADARALAVGFPYVEGLDINENWASLPADATVETLIYQVWGDEVHMHTMLHPQGQLVGAGVSVNDGQFFYILDVAAYWGDAGLTPQPTTLAFGEQAATQQYVSQYIAPVTQAKPATDGSIVHTVQSGQSLWMLATHYGVEIDMLRKLNGLGANDTIYIGQKIIIRGPTAATPSAAASPPAGSPSASFTLQPTAFTPAAAAQTTDQNGFFLNFDTGLWFLIFFGLFALGLILIVIGTSGE